jgi:DNA-binding beta-propeller fold protein YncE
MGNTKNILIINFYLTLIKMRGKYLFVLTGLSLLLLFTGCKKDEIESLYVSPAKIEFDYNEDNATISISCMGSDEFSWTVSGASDIVQFSKSNGTCAKNSPDEFDILLQRQNIHEDSISSTITVSASTGESFSLSLFIHGFPENKIRLSYYLKDVTYDYVHNKLISLAMGNNSYIESIYTLTDETFTTFPVDGNYLTILSVPPNGNFSVISDNSEGNVKYIDHFLGNIVSVFHTPFYADDLIAYNNKTVYIFNSYDNICKMDLSTGSYATFDVGYFGFENGQLHPNGKYIYIAYGSELLKLDITGEDPELIYDEYINGLGYNIWISKDGSRIFTEMKKILTINPEISGYDVIAENELPISQESIAGVEHDLVHNEFYVIPDYNGNYSSGSESNKIMVFDSSYQIIKTITLEDYYLISNFEPGYIKVNAWAEYVFISSDGSKIIIVSKASVNSSYNWGIEIIDE